MKIGKDKVYHAIVCAGATLISFLFMRFLFSFKPAFASCWFLPIGLGLGKEYGDSKASGNKWDWVDVVADVVGIAAVMLVALVWHLIANDGKF